MNCVPHHVRTFEPWSVLKQTRAFWNNSVYEMVIKLPRLNRCPWVCAHTMPVQGSSYTMHGYALTSTACC